VTENFIEASASSGTLRWYVFGVLGDTAAKRLSDPYEHSVIFYVCIAGEAANEWARRNGQIPQAGLPILRLGLAELAHHHGYAKIPAEREEAGAG
jgi:hypothetical protein